MSVSINGTNGLTFSDNSTQNTAAKNGMINRIINGAMVIDQRNAGASVTPTASASLYPVDRFGAYANPSSKYSAQRSTVAPAGFTHSLLCTSLSAYSVASGDLFPIFQVIEGFNVADLGWGTASAQTVTLSFWVRSSLTGTFGGSLRNGAGSRSYPFTYTISAANTWEQKAITVAGDTSGTWTTDNSGGINISWSLGAGSTLSGTAGSWSGSNFISATGATSVVGTNGATFYITGVQLEKGSTATSFDYRDYESELAMCQRYAQLNTAASGKGSTGGGAGAFYVPIMVQMRAAPTITLVTGTNKVDQIYTSQRTISSVLNTFGNDTAGTAISVELAVTSLGANSQCALFGGALLLASEL